MAWQLPLFRMAWLLYTSVSPFQVSLLSRGPLCVSFTTSWGCPQEENEVVDSDTSPSFNTVSLYHSTAEADPCSVTSPVPTVLPVNVDTTYLSPGDVNKLNRLLTEVSDVSNAHPFGYGQTHLVHHNINTGNVAPIKLHHYHMSPAKQAVMQSEVN